jgi:tRNA(adenine34) deaminase
MPTTKKSASAKKASRKRWVKTVTTDSTHPPKDLFTRSASVIARSLASKQVSPKGPASGMRMLTYFINRAGKGLTAARKKELERAKMLLHERIQKDKQQKAA